VQRNANKIFWMSASFPVRVIREIHRVGLEAWKRKIDEMEIPSKSPLWKNPEPLELVNGLTKLIFRNLLRKWREMRFPAHWEIGILSGLEFENQVIPRKDVSFFPEKKNSEGFFADPFPIFHGGKWLIFAELFDKKKAKGSIALLDELGNAQVVLEEPWHLSYPFVWEEGGNNYLLPESAEAGQLFLYRAVDFPFSWEKAQVIFPKEAYDPTLWKTEEGYWLFVNQKSHPACSPFDELYLYFSSTLTSPDWISHPENPIVSNVGSSRPAGRLFVKNGILYRPAQDSEKRYGHRMRIMEVKELSRVRYREQEAFTIEADETGGFLGVHSLNQMGDRWVVDFYSRK
jgi:hypothetical protein